MNKISSINSFLFVQSFVASPLSQITKEIGLDKSTIGRFEKGKSSKKESILKMEYFIFNIDSVLI
jgi:hypothetical protein